MSMIKKTKLIITGFCMAAALNLTGCAVSDIKNEITGGSATSTTSAKLPAKQASDVKIYYGSDDLPKHYKVIGRVATENYNIVGLQYSQDSIAKDLKKRAASIGANGVINVNPGFTETTGDAILIK
jgi:hypothetical protein